MKTSHLLLLAAVGYFWYTRQGTKTVRSPGGYVIDPNKGSNGSGWIA